MPHTSPSPLLIIAALAVILSVANAATAQSVAWQLKVCADPNSLPFSNRSEEGFENRIAQVLADELGAQLTYDWHPRGPDTITYRLRAGECDLIMGVPDGSEGLLTTVAYYRSPYVFVYREDSQFRIKSLDDPVLQNLRIAVQNVGIPPHEALVYRGLGDNIVNEYLEGESRVGPGRSRAVIRAVVEGNVDVALAWGPVAGYLAQQAEVGLIVDPVTPQFEPPFRTQSFPMTIGVRPGDEALRRRLSIALAQRWDEIKGVLADYGVPTEQIPRPVTSPPNGGAPRAGFVVPTLTGQTAIQESLYEPVGQAATNGALMAEGDFDYGGPDDGVELDVLFASSPSAEAARRAAERLVVVEGVSALIGGHGEGQAQVLAEVAEEAGSVFLNVGSVSMERVCMPHVLHVEASAATYLDAIASWFSDSGKRWYMVRDESVASDQMAQRARTALRRHGDGAELVGSDLVSREQPSYWQELQNIEESGAEVILLLVNPRDQIAFGGQLDSYGLQAALAPLPFPVTQIREFLAAARGYAPAASDGQRVLLWETTLKSGAAGELNERYMSRWGEPMEPSAWSAYQAVRLLEGAISATGTSEAGNLVRFLVTEEDGFDIGKGVRVSFSPHSHQLRQPLYVVEVQSDAPWGLDLTRKAGVATLSGQVPSAETLQANDAEELDHLGNEDPQELCLP